MLNAPLLLIIGANTLQSSLIFYATIPWQGLVVLPSILVMGVHAIRRSRHGQRAVLSDRSLYVLTYFLSVLGFPSLIYFTSSSGITDYYGWIMAGLFFNSLVRRWTSDTSQTKFTMLCWVWLSALLIYHHTTALFVALIVFGIYLMPFWIRSPERAPRFRLMVVYLVILFGYIAYLTLSFAGYFTSLNAALGNLANGILGTARPSPLATIATTNQFTFERAVIRSVDVAMIIVVFSLIGWTVVRRKVYNSLGIILSGFVVGTAFAAAFLLGWGGFGAFFIRISALSAVVSILGTGYLITHLRPGDARKIVALGILVIVVSPFAYLSSDAAQPGAVRWSEYAALKWIDLHVGKDRPISSDSRLASPLIYFGFQEPIGFEDEGTNLSNQLGLVRIFDGLYYPDSPDAVSLALCSAAQMSGVQPDYAIYSALFAEKDTGVIGYLNSYVPASPNAGDMWDKVVTLDKVYSSGPSSLYKVTPTNGGCNGI